MGSRKYQYGAAMCVNLISIGYGAVCGWPSPAILQLRSEQSPLPTGPITLDEASWITAMICPGGLFGNFLFGWITERFGRKIPLFLVVIPQIIGWYLITIASNISHLYIARFLCGLSGGGAFVIIPSFVAEIAEDKIRGRLGSCLVLSCNTGILIMFVLGNYATYELVPKIVIGIELLFLCIFPLFHESPQYLLKQNKEHEAEKSLRFYRGIRVDDDSDCELLQIELDKLKIVYSEESRLGRPTEGKKVNAITLDDFKSIEAKKSLLIAFVLVALNQLCGCFAMLNYTATIFAEAGSDLSPNMSAIVVGIIQLIGSCITVMLVDRAGRKFLITVSAIGICLGQICLGVFTMMQQQGFPLDSYRWVTVASFSFVIFIGAWGVLSLPFLIMSEIIPEKIRNFGTSSAMAVLWIFSFVMLKMFPMISEALGMGGSMFVYAGFSLLGALFVLFFMPETKGKCFEEIAEMLRK